MKRAILIAIASFGLMGFGDDLIGPTTPEEMTDDYRAAVERGTKADLRDPDSAKFGKMKIGRRLKDGRLIVCGEINAKNAYGGYTGMSPFMGILHEFDGVNVFSLTNIGSDESGVYVITSACRAAKLW